MKLSWHIFTMDAYVGSSSSKKDAVAHCESRHLGKERVRRVERGMYEVHPRSDGDRKPTYYLVNFDVTTNDHGFTRPLDSELIDLTVKK